MKNIFIGFIFIFLDFNLTSGNVKIGLIPDFLGYIIMVKGLVEMADESMLFMKAKPYATGMAIYTGFLYVFDLLGVSASLGVLSYILGFISTIISLYISYNIVMGVMEIERKYNAFLNGASLKSVWTLLAVFNILSFSLLLIPGIAIIFIIVSFVVSVCFLVSFNHSKDLYYNTIV
jgi:hypothetical protein